MKKVNSVIAISTLILVMMFVSCSPTKKISNLCDGNKYNTDEKFFRARFTGQGILRENALEKALFNARTELGNQIRLSVFGVTNRFVDNYTQMWDESLKQKFIGWVEQSIEMTLRNSYQICEKTIQYKNTRYFETQVVVETPKEIYLTYLQTGIANDDKISQDDKTRINFEFDKYREEYKKMKEGYDNRNQEKLNTNK